MTERVDAGAELRRLARDLATAAERLLALASQLDASEARRSSLSLRNDAPAGGAHLYTVPEVMEALSLSRATVYTLIRSGELVSIKVGRSRRIPEIALNRYIADASAR